MRIAKNITTDDFSTLSPEEQSTLMKEYVKELSPEERKILKNMIDNEITTSDNTGAV